MRVRIVLRTGKQRVPPDQFAPLPAGRRPWRGLAGSMCLHAGLAGGLTLSQQLWTPDPLDAYRTSTEFARLVPLRLQIDPPLTSPAMKGEIQAIELAQVPSADEHSAKVIQPDAQKLLARDVPPMFYWAHEQEVPRETVLAPSWKKPPATSALAAAPSITVPNLEALGSHNLRANPATVTPALPLAAGSKGMPVRDTRIDEQVPPSTSWSETGDAVNALVLSEIKPRMYDVVLLPPGSNSGRLVPGGRDGAPGPAASPEAGRAGRAPELARFSPLEYAVVEHPADSVFDVIATHSSSADALPGASVKLSGAPVYTAYVPVGFGKEWIFQYCLVDAGPAVSETRVISLEGAETVDAPFPILTVAPKPPAIPLTSLAVIHGTLSQEGRLSNLSMNGPAEQAGAARLLEALTAWRFRPVMVNARAVEAEVLIGIPPMTSQFR